MDQNKRKKVWKKAWEDPNIIFAIGSVLSSLCAAAGAAVLLVQGTGPWWQLSLAFLALATNFGVLVHFYQQVRKLTEQLETKHLPVCFVIGKPADKAQKDYTDLKNAVSELTGFADFNKIEGFSEHYPCLLAHERNPLPADASQWKRYITDKIQDMSSYTRTLTGSNVYHIAIDGPASLAIGLGTIFGTKYPLVCYQYNGTSYVPVLNLMQNQRHIKEHLPPEYTYHYFSVIYPDKYSPDVAVLLQAAGHFLTADAKKYLQGKGLDSSIIEINSMYSGNLTEMDWVLPVRELFSIFNSLAKVEAIKSIHLFLAIPVALGFGLGMALGQFKPITVYNWEPLQATYFPVLNLNEIGVSL